MTAPDPQDPPLVVGIGASAGGLKALQAFFKAVPFMPQVCFIVVQHLPTEYESHLDELLARNTDFTVMPARHGVKIEGGTIYTGPAGRRVFVEDGHLRLDEQVRASLQPRLVDVLFGSLAAAAGSDAIAVVLSGAGSDGTQGALSVKEVRGVVLVQSPADAEFDGMPSSVIDTLKPDLIAPVSELAQHLVSLIEKTTPESLREADAGADDGVMERIIELIDAEEGYNFRDYKRTTLFRRVQRRVGLTRSENLEAYLELVTRDRRERRLLIEDLMIIVTQFFRDAPVWDATKTQVIEPLLRKMEDGETLRAWVAGCATGEEAYSLAILLKEHIKQTQRQIDLQIFATDLNSSAIKTARAGRYSIEAMADIPRELQDRWFQRDDNELIVASELRESLVFAVQNAVMDPPFSAVDLITCRNLLIYLQKQPQQRLLQTFHFALREDGFLILGTSESVDVSETPFAVVDKQKCIFRRVPGGSRRTSSYFSKGSRLRTTNPEEAPYRPKLDKSLPVHAMLKRFAPPAVLIDKGREALGFHGDVTPFLDFRSGSFSGNVMALIQGRYAELLAAMIDAAAAEQSVKSARVPEPGADGATTEIIVEPLLGEDGSGRMMIYFVRNADPAERPERAGDAQDHHDQIRNLEQRLAYSSASEGSTAFELQTANEEIMSANEELQSSNEELETSREELQSLNEELNTINAELKDKVRELENTNDDLANLISSTDIATIFLDRTFCIRRFSKSTQALVNVRESDIGRPFSDLVMKIEDSDVFEVAQEVLGDLKTRVSKIEGEDHAYLRRITPFRTRSHHIEGVIVTYTDVQPLRIASNSLQRQISSLETIAQLSKFTFSSDSIHRLVDRIAHTVGDHLDAPIVEIHRLDAQNATFNLSAAVGWPESFVGKLEVANTEDNHLSQTLRQSEIAEYVVDATTSDQICPHIRDAGAAHGMCIAMGPRLSPGGVIGVWRKEDRAFDADDHRFFGTVADIAWLGLTQVENRQRQERERQLLQDLINGLPIMIGVLDEDFVFEAGNIALEKVGFTADEIPGKSLKEVFGASTETAVRDAARQEQPDASDLAEVEIDIPGAGPTTFLMHCAPRGQTTDMAGYYIAAIDIDERKKSEERNAVISAELDHRVKNILSLVSVIARMSGQNSQDIGEFRTDFQNRINSFARTHSMLAEKSWDGLSLRQLLADEFRAFSSLKSDQISMQGEDLFLGIRPTQSLALAVHEMTTNAVKYGGLSLEGGSIDIKWTVEDDLFRFVWTEDGLDGLQVPEAEGYGTQVLKTTIAFQMKGRIETEYRPSGVEYRIEIPFQQIGGQVSDDA